MNIFVRDVPEAATNRQISDFLRPHLRECNILDSVLEKTRDRKSAIITVLSPDAGKHFLRLYGVPQGARPHVHAPRRLYWDQKYLKCMPSKNEPSDWLLRALRYEAENRVANERLAAVQPPTRQPPGQRTTKFNISTLECGLWDYTNPRGQGTKLTFVSHFTDFRQGHIHFGRNQAIILLQAQGFPKCRVDLNYRDCKDITLGTNQDPSITFNMELAPMMYEVSDEPDAEDVTAQFAAMMLGQRPPSPREKKKVRLSAINPAHGQVAGSCFVYRILLKDSNNFALIRQLLGSNPKMCAVHAQLTEHQIEPLGTWSRTYARLTSELSDVTRFGSKPFSLRFQINRMARNGILPPGKVIQLLAKISQLNEAFGLNPTLAALSRLIRERVLPGPETEAHEFSLGALEELLENYTSAYDPDAPENPYELAKRHSHINMIHKAVITPAGIYLEGPEPEPTNRVLRRWSDKTDHFIRVIFLDEDRGPVRYDGRTDQSQIYHGRFKGVLDTSFLICGFSFSFLGFSHSSLRSQSCWFSAPLVTREGEIMFAQAVIKQLGNFESIRSPSKCAARIGQNFTDTNATIELKENQVLEMPNVERTTPDGITYDFSDGVGTISSELLKRVHRRYGSKRWLKPSVLQIRFQGYKGMVSLDSRLPGKRLMLRPNMKKYETAATWNLEICGAGFRPLPMILNRQFIKIFEDLGIQMSVFLDLQSAAMTHLQRMTASPINTATFVNESDCTRATRLPDLIRYLGHIGLDYHQDNFLYSVVEMLVVAKLRDIKYRGRIPVEEGLTLYGIMDETGYLDEGEIFVITEKGPDAGVSILEELNVLVTRSPALHPGDVQRVKAITVPQDSPLRQLRNVVVFSKHGQRDLPSQLSGGDLDGDLYNVIWAPRLIPRTTYQAAQYPRVVAPVLDREVTRKDMSDFFVTFMESDVLGMICNIHLQLADQRPTGTLDPDCIKLAQMASTAVDFSKTGIPVNMRECPPHPRQRPDFMSPSPRVMVTGEGVVDFEDEEVEDDDAFDGLDAERRPIRYYASQNTLGHLYRAIDERKFLANMQQHHRQRSNRTTRDDLISTVLRYVKRFVVDYGINYIHHKTSGLASSIRAGYEDSLSNLLYSFEPSPHHPLSEAEIFAGQILGRHGGPQGKPLREQSKAMRERFEIVVDHAVMRITKGDEAMREAKDLDDLFDSHYDEREFEALPRAIACLEVACSEKGYEDRRLGELKSFKYVAAGVCLKELERYRITTFGSGGLPLA